MAFRYPTVFLLLFTLFSASLQGQAIGDDFEGGGTLINWYGDDCGMDVAFSNPFSQGINTSATVLRYADQGGAYANVRFEINGHFDLSSQASFSLKLYVPSSGLTGAQPNQISLKLQDGGLPAPWSTQSEIVKPIVLDQWQEVTFDFASDPYINLDPNSPNPTTRTDFNRVVLQLNGENNNDEVLAYLDDVLFHGSNGNVSVFNQLVWSDEFNGSGAIDTSKWHHQTQLPNGVSWYNGEIQHYTDRVDNSYLANGHLHILAKKETYTDQGQTKQYTSARLNSKFAFTYGRVEVRAKLPEGHGTWPAIWMLGKNITEPGGYWAATYGTTGWPACGEIDIMEHWGTNQNYIQSALHTPSSFGSTVNLGGILATDVANTFHTYALEWTAGEMQFSMDGNVYYTYAPSPQDPSNWPFDADQYLLLNIAIEASIDPAFTESPMVIDYVRVYQQGTTAIAPEKELEGFELYPNPVTDKLNLRFPEGVDSADIKVFSSLGQLVFEGREAGPELSLDWRKYTAGLYKVVLETERGGFAYKVLKK